MISLLAVALREGGARPSKIEQTVHTAPRGPPTKGRRASRVRGLIHREPPSASHPPLGVSLSLSLTLSLASSRLGEFSAEFSETCRVAKAARGGDVSPGWRHLAGRGRVVETRLDELGLVGSISAR